MLISPVELEYVPAMQSVHAEDPVESEQGGAAPEPALGVCASRSSLALIIFSPPLPCPRPTHPAPTPAESFRVIPSPVT